MIRLKTLLLTGAATMVLAPPVLAQTAPPPAPALAATPATEEPPAEAASAVADVVVTARATDVRTSIDSVSYSLANDLQATTGSLADALRNVPSVDVDPQGNVSLRGDSGVTILVDGRPSGVLSGEGRAQALLQLPADQYARIEVMTNPSAAYSPEGSGGVINLVTKPRTARPGTQTTGSIRANVGDNGRWNLGGSGSWQKDKLTLSGDLSYRVDPNRFGFNRLREQLDPVTGAVVSTTRNDQATVSDQTGTVGRFAVDYRLSDRTQLTGELRGVAFEGDRGGPGLFETRDAGGTVTGAYARDDSSAFRFRNGGATARLLHRFDEAGHEWSGELRYDVNDIENAGLALTRFLVPAGTDLVERNDQAQNQVTLGFTSAYVRPTADGGKVRLGYEVTGVRPDQEVTFSRGPSAGTLAVVPGLSNRFEARQTVHALYGTWERPLTEAFSAQAGLRLEQADIRVEDLTGGTSASQDYFRAYPTAHLQYQLSETQTLRASYSRRIQRPQPGQLNPFVSYGDPLNRRSGNPDLEPQETDSFEAMWQKRQGSTFYQLTAYLRDTDKAFTETVTDLGGGVLLTRPENLGGRRDTGLEATANGQLHASLRYSASVNVFRQAIDAGGIAGGGDRSATLASGRASLNWQPTPTDFVQLSGFWQGDSLLAQGRREGGGMVNLGYRRKLSETLSLNVTGRDLFNGFNSASVYETPLFRERTEQNIRLRAFYIGLSWSLGAGPRRQPEQFDFSTGPTGG
ncbi:MAG: outer membrane receptor protein involved in Fe transport [Brevundimonas sp.]|jgi:outer membrane receptor protein involved in Fe transport|uniref:TonB-dependent receptor domain-containing protein n=1 Tax=Brevundimonas sp. TaxID=1871086 RepID=UPI0039E34628